MRLMDGIGVFVAELVYYLGDPVVIVGDESITNERFKPVGV